MDRKELVRNVFHNQPTDKLLVAFWHHYLRDELVDGLRHPEYIRENLAGARRFKEEFDPDFVKVMTDGLFFLPFDYDSIRTASDLRDLRPEKDLERYYEKSVEFAAAVREIYGDGVLIFYNVFSPTFQINHRMAQTHPALRAKAADPFPLLIAEDAEAVGAAIERLADATEELIDRVIRSGLTDGMYFSVSCYNRGVAPETYRRYIMPAEKRLIAAANRRAGDNILHICGWRGSRNDLSLFTDYDCSVINWAVHAEGVSLAEGKLMFGGKCVIGGFGNDRTDLLCAGTREEIQAYVEKIVSEAGKTGVIIGADCTTHLDTPDEHLHWVYEKAARLSGEF